MPVVIGGGGKTKTAQLSARYASEYNRAFSSVESFQASVANVSATFEAIGRDPGQLANVSRPGGLLRATRGRGRPAGWWLGR